jgi:hypothetical protein
VSLRFEVNFAPVDNNAFDLRLDVTEAPLEVLVIDHAEGPDAN